MTRASSYFAWQGRLVRPHLGRRVVEIGCGIGNFTGRLLDRELVVAVDTEADCVQRLLERYPAHSNLHAFVSEDFASLARFAPDSVVCLNVLEHIEDDRRALRQMASMLPSGGVIVLLLPAFPALFGPIDRNLGHHRRYTRTSLVRLADACGLLIRRAHYVNALGFFGWWLNAHLFHREAQSPAQIALFDHLVAPVMSRVEALVKPPFGQSLLAVLEK
ncbi:Ribosomal RNA adenine methylase transferase (fragment) [Candidatus Sulfopaludibacter sp. SbA3]